MPSRRASLILTLLAVTACEENVGPGIAVQTITAEIDGVAWTATTRSASHAGGVLTIEGTNAAQQTIRLTIPNITVRGTYFVEFGNVNGASAQVIEGGNTWSSAVVPGQGVINVTLLAVDRTAGTYSFTAVPAGGGATGVRTVTLGNFALDYTQ